VAGPLRIACIVLTGALLLPAVAHAKNDEQGRPWARGTWAIGPGFGVGFGGDVTSLTFGVGGEYYVLHGWSFGADVSDTVFIYSDALESEFPGLKRNVATNAFFFIPQSRYVFYRSYRFSPWVRAGVGPVALNHGGGAAGQWVAEPGVYIGLAGPVYLRLGVTFSGIFTKDVCNDAFTFEGDAGAVRVEGVCGFQWSPGIGIVFAPKGKTRRERRREENQRRAAPPQNPMYEAPLEEEPGMVTPEPEPEVEPSPEPAPSPEPTEVGPEPSPEPQPAPEPTPEPPGPAPMPDPAAPEPLPAPTPGPEPAPGPAPVPRADPAPTATR
jgi:hypothetical protein